MKAIFLIFMVLVCVVMGGGILADRVQDLQGRLHDARQSNQSLSDENARLHQQASQAAAERELALDKVRMLESQVAVLQQQNADLITSLQAQQQTTQIKLPPQNIGGGADLIPQPLQPRLGFANLSLAQVLAGLLLFGMAALMAIFSLGLYLAGRRSPGLRRAA